MKRFLELGLILVLLLAGAGCNKADEGTSPSANADGTSPSTLTASAPAPAAAAPGEICAGCGKPEAECTCGKEAGAETKAGAEVCAGCGKPESQCTCSEEKAGSIEAAPASITLASGKTVKVVGVAALNEDPKAHTGLVAIDGTVGELYADKGRFMLVDCATAAACTDPGCASCGADMKVPVRFDVASVKGDLPEVRQRVFVVAEIAPTKTGGFELKVQEVRTADKTIFSV
jgi:hypothetical protein